MKKTMTLRVYKEEFNVNQLAYLSKEFKVVEETTHVLTISGTEDEIEKVMHAIFTTDDEFKELFPTFLTEEERIRFTKEQYEATKIVIREKLLQIIAHGVVGEEFNKLYEFFKTM